MKGTGIIGDLHEVLFDIEGVELLQMDNTLHNYTCCIVSQKA